MSSDTEWPGLKQALEAYGDNVLQALKDNLSRQGINSTTELVASMQCHVEQDEKGLCFQLSMPAYYTWLDEGRQPGRMPPVTSLAVWASAHLNTGTLRNIKPPTLKTHKHNKLNRQLKPQNLTLRAAWAVAKSIAKNGTKPTYFYTDVFKPGAAGDMDKLWDILKGALNKDLTYQLNTLMDGNTTYNT